MTPRRRRLLPLVAVGTALACAALPASAHEGQDERPGAASMDLEVLVTPSVSGETSPGGQEGSVAVDRFGNVIAAALKEQAFRVVGPDGRAATKTRLSSWRWSSGDDGESFQNLSRNPAAFDTLVPGGLSTAAAADDAGHSYLAESFGGALVVTQATATERDDVLADASQVLAVGTGTQRVRLDAVGNASTSGRLHVLAAALATPGDAAVWSGPSTAMPKVGVTLPGARSCTLAADHRAGARLVYAACTDPTGAVALWTSKDAGTTFSRRVIAPASAPLDPPSVTVGPDGAAWVLVTTGSTTASRMTVYKISGARVSKQEVTSEKGLWRGAVLDVSRTGRLGLAAYHLRPGAKDGWHVRLAVTSPGRAPVWVDFASHDPVSAVASGPPDSGPAIAFGPDARLHLLWASTKVTLPGSDAPVLRNIWSVRTLSS